jgi:diguanylate cyclase (GGDEF)-like protein
VRRRIKAMGVVSLATWVLSRHPAPSPAARACDGGAELTLRRRLGWALPAGVGFAAIAAGAGAAFRDRPTPLAGLLLVAAVGLLPLALHGLAARTRLCLDAALAEHASLHAELADARRAKDALRELAYHDELTGLPRRSLLYDRLGLAIAHAQRAGSQLAVLFLDLDDFKDVNDSYGHGAGDRLLVELSARLRRGLRAGDTVARLGGDEFVLLLDQVTGAEDAARVAAKVRAAVQAPFRRDGRDVRVTASIGLSVYPADGTTPEELVRSADAAMYRDKERRAATL